MHEVIRQIVDVHHVGILRENTKPLPKGGLRLTESGREYNTNNKPPDLTDINETAYKLGLVFGAEAIIYGPREIWITISPDGDNSSVVQLVVPFDKADELLSVLKQNLAK